MLSGEQGGVGILERAAVAIYAETADDAELAEVERRHRQAMADAGVFKLVFSSVPLDFGNADDMCCTSETRGCARSCAMPASLTMPPALSDLAASLAAFTAAILTARGRRVGVILAMFLITLHGSSVVWTAWGQPAETLTALWGGLDFQRSGGVVYVVAGWFVFMMFSLAAGRAQRRRRVVAPPVHQVLL